MSDEIAELAQNGTVDGDEFSQRERIAVRYTEHMHDHVSSVTDDLIASVRKEFNDAEFVELGFTVAQFISMGQFVHPAEWS